MNNFTENACFFAEKWKERRKKSGDFLPGYDHLLLDEIFYIVEQDFLRSGVRRDHKTETTISVFQRGIVGIGRNGIFEGKLFPILFSFIEYGIA